MTPVELIALSLTLSIAVAAITGLAAAGLERATSDPTLRDRAWAWALYLPVLPPLAVAATLLTPAPVRPIPILPSPIQTTEAVDALPVAADPVTPAFTLDLGQLALAALMLAALLIVLRLASLALRGWRLNHLIARTQPASPETRTIVAERAACLAVASPTVRVGPAVGDALLTGLTRPVLVLPQALADTPDTPAARAIITHELAHLKRGDHRAVWIEEAIVALLAANPILRLIRARRAAAREEACDALALTGANPATRRAYATSLIEALRARTAPPTLPALTFNGTPRSQAMRRLKSILTPPSTAGRGTRLAAAAGGIGLVALVGLTSVAVASQRQAAPASATAEVEDPNWPNRYLKGTAKDGQLFCAAPQDNRDRTFGCDSILWQVAEQEERAPTGAFCVPATREADNLRVIAERARPLVIATASAAGTIQDGARRALVTAFPCRGDPQSPVSAELTAAQRRLGAEWTAQHAARSAAETAATAARIRTETAADVKASCRAGGTAEAGCDGMIFGVAIGENLKPADERRFCAPENSDRATDLASRMKNAIAAAPTVAENENGRAFVLRVMTEAYPCQA